MHLPELALLLLAALPVPRTEGATVVSSIRGGATGARVDAVLHARRIDAAAEPVERSLTVPSSETLPLAEGVWELRLAAEGFWSQPVQMSGREAAVELWPAGIIRARAATQEKVRVQFTGAASGEVECSADADVWQCVVPAGEYDLRFLNRGAAPEFRWGAKVEADKVLDAGALQFVPGAALLGRVTTKPGTRLTTGNVTISLTGDARTQTVKPNERGVFLFRNVTPGHYTVRAIQPGFASYATPVHIIEGATAELKHALLLDRPKRLDVTLMPPLDPDGQPWQVTLLAPVRANRLDVLTGSRASAAGEWSHANLLSGEYAIEVRRSDQSLWSLTDITINEEDLALPLLLLGQAATGRATLGGKPLAAMLELGGEGGQRVTTDERGEFRTTVPASKREAWKVLVTSDAPAIRQTLTVKPRRSDDGTLHFNVSLGGGVLRGRVIDEQGTPQPEAILTLRSRDHVDQFFVDDGGEFQAAGLGDGEYELIAEVFEKRSRPARISIENETPAEAELIVTSTVQVRGEMMMRDAPAIGSVVYALPRDSSAIFVPRATTDERGRFLLELPPGTSTFDVVAIHPAFDVMIGRAMVRSDKLLHLAVQQQGGTLEVRTKKADGLLLRHDGAEVALGWLARESGGAVAEEQITVRRLEPGPYAVCNREGKCVSGFVPSGSTLALTF